MNDFPANVLVIALVIINLTVGIGLAVPLAKQMRTVSGSQKNVFRYFAMMLGLYFLECVAFTWGMCTQVFTIALSFIWAVLFGMWLRGLALPKQIVRQILFVSLYGCLPTVSFAAVLFTVWVIAGNGLLNVEQAYQFGIPDFLPWPFNTILVFSIALAAGTTILKTVVSTGMTWIVISGHNP